MKQRNKSSINFETKANKCYNNKWRREFLFCFHLPVCWQNISRLTISLRCCWFYFFFFFFFRIKWDKSIKSNRFIFSSSIDVIELRSMYKMLDSGTRWCGRTYLYTLMNVNTGSLTRTSNAKLNFRSFHSAKVIKDYVCWKIETFTSPFYILYKSSGLSVFSIYFTFE